MVVPLNEMRQARPRSRMTSWGRSILEWRGESGMTGFACWLRIIGMIVVGRVADVGFVSQAHTAPLCPVRLGRVLSVAGLGVGWCLVMLGRISVGLCRGGVGPAGGGGGGPPGA